MSEKISYHKYLKYKNKYLALRKKLFQKKGGAKNTVPMELFKNIDLENIEYIHISAHGSVGDHIRFEMYNGTEIFTFSEVGKPMLVKSGDLGIKLNKYINDFLENGNTFIEKNTEKTLSEMGKVFFASENISERNIELKILLDKINPSEIKNRFCKPGQPSVVVNNMTFNFDDTDLDMKKLFGIYFIYKNIKGSRKNTIFFDADKVLRNIIYYKLFDESESNKTTLEKLVMFFDKIHKHKYIINSCRSYSNKVIVDEVFYYMNILYNIYPNLKLKAAINVCLKKIGKKISLSEEKYKLIKEFIYKMIESNINPLREKRTTIDPSTLSQEFLNQKTDYDLFMFVSMKNSIGKISGITTLRSMSNMTENPVIFNKSELLGLEQEKLCNYDLCTNFISGKVPPLQTCSRCKLVYYCNIDHQRKDWMTHKLVCVKTT
jgi:hypothetical protein